MLQDEFNCGIGVVDGAMRASFGAGITYAVGAPSRRPAARWFLGRAIPKRNLRPALVDSNRSGFVQKIEAITAPAPLLRHSRQSPLHRIAMHIAELLHALLRRPYVEIV